jgi:hypothetical protein
MPFGLQLRLRVVGKGKNQSTWILWYLAYTMHKQVLVLAAGFAGHWVQALGMPDSVARQCSLIREVVFQASQRAFAQLIDTEARGSYGKQTHGNWTFSNDVYGTRAAWPNSSKSQIMHYLEALDSTQTESWQYIADFDRLPDVLAAERVFQHLNLQILGCPYAVGADTLLHFAPLPLSALPPSLPDGFETASLYQLSLPQPAPPAGELMVMVGKERRESHYRVSLIVDYTIRRPRPN